MPATIPLLTMIRLTEDVGTEIQMRQCPPVETYIFSLRLQMWPVFQKGMSEHIESLKRIAEGTNSGYFGRASTTTNTFVSNVCYLLLLSIIYWIPLYTRSANVTSTTLTLLSIWRVTRRRRWYSRSTPYPFTCELPFSDKQYSLLRLRQELIKLITRHTNQISDPVRKATSLSTLFEIVLQGLSVSLTTYHFNSLHSDEFIFRTGHIILPIQNRNKKLHIGPT